MLEGMWRICRDDAAFSERTIRDNFEQLYANLPRRHFQFKCNELRNRIWFPHNKEKYNNVDSLHVETAG